MSAAAPGPRTLVAGVGYSDLRDVSVGPVLTARLAGRGWPASVTVEDFGFSAIDAVHRLRAAGFARGLFFGAVCRGDPPGTIRRYRYAPEGDARTVQAHVAQAAQAVIDLETTVIVAGHFGALPDDTVVFEVEPEDLGYGDGFSPAVARAVDRLEAMLAEAVGVGDA